MIIRTGTLGIYFPVVPNMRENIFRIEKALGTKFARPFNLIALPDGSPPEIPRIIGVTQHQHSNLSISLNHAQLSTNFDSNFNSDSIKCIKYMHDNGQDIFNTISETVGKTYFCGYTFVAEFEGAEKSVDLITHNFIKIKPSVPVYDAGVHLTFCYKNAYFINIDIHNVREYSGVSTNGSLYGMTEKSNVLTVTIDINDRLAFNNRENYFSDQNSLSEEGNIMQMLLSGKIQELIKNGVLKI